MWEGHGVLAKILTETRRRSFYYVLSGEQAILTVADMSLSRPFTAFPH